MVFWNVLYKIGYASSVCSSAIFSDFTKQPCFSLTFLLGLFKSFINLENINNIYPPIKNLVTDTMSILIIQMKILLFLKLHKRHKT